MVFPLSALQDTKPYGDNAVSATLFVLKDHGRIDHALLFGATEVAVKKTNHLSAYNEAANKTALEGLITVAKFIAISEQEPKIAVLKKLSDLLNTRGNEQLKEEITALLTARLEKAKIDAAKDNHSTEENSVISDLLVDSFAEYFGSKLQIQHKEHFAEIAAAIEKEFAGTERDILSFGNNLPNKKMVEQLQLEALGAYEATELAEEPEQPITPVSDRKIVLIPKSFGNLWGLLQLLGLAEKERVELTDPGRLTRAITSMSDKITPEAPKLKLALVAGEVGDGHVDVSSKQAIRIESSSRSLIKPIFLAIAASIAVLGAVAWSFISNPFKSTEKPSAKTVPEVIATPKSAAKPEPEIEVDVAKPVTPAVAVAPQVTVAAVTNPSGTLTPEIQKPESLEVLGNKYTYVPNSKKIFCDNKEVEPKEIVALAVERINAAIMVTETKSAVEDFKLVMDMLEMAGFENLAKAAKEDLIKWAQGQASQGAQR